MKLEFPCGVVEIDAKRTERKLAECLADSAFAGDCQALVTHDGARWHVTIKRRFGSYSASSELGLLDAFANALQAAVGREECDPEVT